MSRYAKYIGKMFCPNGLCILPPSGEPADVVAIFASTALLLTLTGNVWPIATAAPGLGLKLFVVTLSPVD